MPSLLSIVVPAYNEAENLPLLHRRISALNWTAMDADFELIIADDCSSDSTPQVLESLRNGDPRVKWLRFSRNFGSHMAVTAALLHCAGDAAVVMAADLQDPPEIIPRLIDRWRQGSRVVWAVRDSREGESPGTLLAARIYYFLMRRISDFKPPPEGADFLLLDRAVIEALRQSPEKHTTVFGLVQWMGFSQASVEYTKAARAAGVSKWTFRKKIKLCIDSLVSFSYVPIRMMAALGLLTALLGFAYAAVVVVRALAGVAPVSGWSSLMCVVLVMSGVQMLLLGILGEYLWRTYDETRKRPAFIIESTRGLEARNP
jgi:dolichol-phosphate mannosyltransferase